MKNVINYKIEGISKPKRPVLHLDAPGQQEESVLFLEVSTPQGPVPHLDVFTLKNFSRFKK
jgi:hypothetical protein